MPQNHRFHCSETETPPLSQVQDYLARKYASLGVCPPEPNGHQPDHIPATPSDQRCDVAGTSCEEQSNTAENHTDSVRSVRFENAESVQPPHPSPTPGEQRSDFASIPPSPEPSPSAKKPKPLTREQRSALDLLDRGQSVTEIMDTLGRSRQTFYDWGKANPAFAHGAESARDNRRGVLADGVHDLQLAALSLVGNYIRSDNSPDSIRLRAASLVFRYAHSETLLPRRILATFTAPDGISPASPAPDFPDPLDPPNEDPNPQNPAGPSGDQAPFDREEPSDLANTESDERSNVAHSTPEAGSPEPESGSTPSPTSESAVTTTATATTTAASPTEKSADPVRSVRFENSQSTSPAPDMHMSAPLRTPSVSAGIPPSPERERRDPVAPSAQAPTAEGTDTNDASPRDERSDVAPSQGEQRSDLANSTPEAAFVPSPYAGIAMMFLEYDDTAEIRFYDRLAKQRKDHEAALERLEAKLHNLQQRREARAGHHAAAHRSTVSTRQCASVFDRVIANTNPSPGEPNPPHPAIETEMHTVAA